MISTSAQRVVAHTDDAVNDRIRRRTDRSLAHFAAHPERIERRLRELDEEWDIERALETGSSALTLAGLLLGAARSRKWLLLSFVVQGFFMQHALQGWCPPLPVLRRLGFRTQYEIERERYGLKALRGDREDPADRVK
jgi:sirohydrochlorin ferrochelatase